MTIPESIGEAIAQLQSGEVTSQELVEALLDRISALNEVIAAFVTVTADSALRVARHLDVERAAGRVRGPLHGIPYAAKDVFATKGVRTTAHSRHLLDNVPREDAASVARLGSAGGILLGKLATHEFGFGGPADDLPFPPARNPWNPDHVPGGSSSGPAVAVAAGLCLAALATDAGGSIRAPAAYCGVVGLKPSFGRISRAGVVGLSSSLDTVGVMTRTVADCALVYKQLAGPDRADPTTLDLAVPEYSPRKSLDGFTIGVLSDLRRVMPALSDAQAHAYGAAVTVLRDLGAKIMEVTIPELHLALAVSRAILFAEAFATHRERLQTRPDAYSQITRDRLTMGMFVDRSDYFAAVALRPRLIQSVESMFDAIHALALPATDGAASRFEERNFSPFLPDVDASNAFNVTGHPYLVVPCGISKGLPLGLELVARRFDEATLFAVGGAYEARAPLTARTPLAPRRAG